MKFTIERPHVDPARAEMLAAWTAAHPEAAAWLSNSDLDFAASLRAGLARWGGLTERQLQAVERIMAGEKARAADAGDPAAQAAPVECARLLQALALALASGLKRPSLHAAGFVFSLAKGKPGVVYVKDARSGWYCGKVDGGAFHGMPALPADRRTAIVEVLSDPEAAAIAHGKLTGKCAVCSRPLSDSESVARGIGPVCARRMGWLQRLAMADAAADE